MYLVKSVLRIAVLVLVGIELVGCFCINSLMFHPVRQYDAGHPGYVDIGTKVRTITISSACWGWMSIESC